MDEITHTIMPSGGNWGGTALGAGVRRPESYRGKITGRRGNPPFFSANYLKCEQHHRIGRQNTR